MNQPICAIITAPGAAAISVIRISGLDAIRILSAFFRPAAKLLKAKPNTIVFGTFYDLDGIPLDEVLCSVFHAPKSYTGEETVELSCHGNPDLTNRILENLLTQAALAKPGEFTLRAYLNGKMNLVQAEAVNDLILAHSSKAEMAALMQVKGILSQHLEGILARIIDARMRCELAIDFSDQDLPQIDLDDLLRRIDGLLKDSEALYLEGSHSTKLREGIKICLAGAPNAGKSSLFNAFLKQNRAIVTPHPGTTRDYLEESFSLSGYPVVLFDTAGIRTASDSIEKEGIARTHQLMQEADLILYLYEQDFCPQSMPKELATMQDKTIFVASKADLNGNQPLLPEHVSCSTITRNGLDKLSEHILSRLQLPQEILYRPLITNARHLAALKRCIQALSSAHAALAHGHGFEFIAFDLKSASSALEDILGVISSDDLLGRIFSGFCIGK